MCCHVGPCAAFLADLYTCPASQLHRQCRNMEEWHVGVILWIIPVKLYDKLYYDNIFSYFCLKMCTVTVIYHNTIYALSE